MEKGSILAARGMTRRGFAVLAATAVVTAATGLSGCGASDSSAPALEVNVDRVWTVGSYDGKRLLVVDVKVRNVSQDGWEPDSVVYSGTNATQKGTSLSLEYLPEDVPGVLSRGARLAAGEEGQAQIVFALESEDPVELVVLSPSKDASGSVETLRETIDPSSAEKVESEQEFKVVVDDVSVTDDGNGKDLLVMRIEFTNDSDAAASFSGAVDMSLFQDDVELKGGYLPYNHPAANEELESNAYTDVRKGASLKVQVVYELLDAASPVEMQLIDMGSFDRRVFMQKIIEITGSVKA